MQVMLDVKAVILVEAGSGNERARLIDDVAERKNNEARLKKSETRYRMLFESASDAIFVLEAEGDQAGKVILANEAAANMHGYAVDELLQLSIQDLDTPENDGERPKRMQSVINGEQVQFEAMHVRKDGSVFPVEVRAILIELDGHKYILAFERDITARKRAEELSGALNNINAIINSTFDYDEIMRGAVVEAAKVTGVETAAIALRKKGYWRVKYLHGSMEGLHGATLPDDKATGMVLAEQTKKIVIVQDALTDKRVNPEMMSKLGIRSVLIMPLMVRDEVIGVLFFTYHTAKAAFSEEQIDFASKLATSLSLALENARLYEIERNIANTLQEAILAMPAHIEGLEFGHLYRSATEAAKVGGDFYDIFKLDDNKVGVVIGDVSGKGIGSTALTSIVKNTLRAYAYVDHTPDVVMTKTNKFAIRVMPALDFVTIFFGVLDVRTGEFIYCCAGHPPAIVRKGTGVALLDTLSPMVAAFKDIRYRCGREMLAPGDILILYTDGIIEARQDNSKLFGEDALLRLVEELPEMPAKDIPEIVLKHVAGYADGKLLDDIAILALRLEDDVNA